MTDMRRCLLKRIARSSSPNLLRYDKLRENQTQLISFSERISKQNEHISKVLFEDEISSTRREQLLTRIEDNEKKHHRINYLLDKGFARLEQLQNLLQQECHTGLAENENSS